MIIERFHSWYAFIPPQRSIVMIYRHVLFSRWCSSLEWLLANRILQWFLWFTIHTGWWFGTLLFFHILGMSSSQSIFIFFREVQPENQHMSLYFMEIRLSDLNISQMHHLAGPNGLVWLDVFSHLISLYQLHINIIIIINISLCRIDTHHYVESSCIITSCIPYSSIFHIPWYHDRIHNNILIPSIYIYIHIHTLYIYIHIYIPKDPITFWR